MEKFGVRQINVLAKGLAFIGPTGKTIERAKKSFQSALEKDIFSFLEKNRLLDTHHTGGNVVYLTRNV